MKEYVIEKAKEHSVFLFIKKHLAMAKRAKKIRTQKGLKLKIVNPDAAGIDVSSREMQVCVPLDRDADNNRKFGVFTEDLGKISEWLKCCRITTVAMESTGIYRVPLYMHLIEQGIEVYLVNAKAVKNFVEEKTDEVDAESLMLMHAYGLLKPSFQVDGCAREIRNLSRHRDNLVRSSSTEIQHMQKSMELMNIKLSNVISDIDGKSGQLIIRAILAGERNPEKLSALADPRCKTPKEVIAKSLAGSWNPDLLFALRQSYHLYLFLQKQIDDCEKEMENLFRKYSSKLPAQSKKMVRSNKQVQKKTAFAST
jgi:DNA-binding protein YbaB